MSLRNYYLCVLVIVCLFCGLQGVKAQIYTARLVDAADGSPVAFANIGILESETGTNSDEEGKFSLNITPDLNAKTMSVFLIGYEDFKLPVEEFTSRVNSNNSTIRLYKKENQLREVVVKPTKLTPARLGNFIECKEEKGLPIPYVFEEKKKKSGKVKRAADTLTEVGTLMRVKGKTTFIDSIAINVGHCTYPEIVYRVNIYELVDGEQKLILNEPIYIRKKQAEIGKVLKVDLTTKNLVVHNNFIVSIERVKDLGQGEFTVCGSLSGSPLYLRIASQQSSFIKIPIISFGISAYVTFSEEIK
jgi:hypothetical protein